MPAVQVECPKCGDRHTFVVNTGTTETSIVRRRKCKACAHRWYSYQPHEQPMSAYDVITPNKKPQLRHDPV